VAASGAPALRRAASLAAATAALAGVLVLAGCGGGGAGSGGGPSGAAPAGAGDYRWLVPTQGPAPSVAAENSRAGTSAWRLPGPSRLIGGAGEGDIAGYAAREAIAPGQVQTIYVDAPRARTVRVDVFRMGWYDGRGGRAVLASRPLAATRQPPCAHSERTGLTECRWRPTLSFPIPTGLASGVYVAKLSGSDGSRRDCLFVVRAATPPLLLVQIPTTTYEAYNGWGGDSLYPGGRPVALTGSTQGVEVSYDRPYESETGAGQFFIREVALVRFLERYGYPAAYTTDASVDAEPAQLAGVRAVIDAGHSEYWSQRQKAAFDAALAHGTSLLFLSSDTLAWRVRYAPGGPASSGAGERSQRIVAYKQYVPLDPRPARATGLFPLGGADLTGSAYNGCITPRLEVPGPPVYRYFGWRPDPALRPPWLFAGTGVTAATTIGGIAGYEFDQRTAASPQGTQLVGASAGASCMAETEPSPVSGTAGETTLYTAPSGALVFAAGMMGWLYGLSPVPEASPDVPRAPDPRIVAMTRNLLARALGSTAP
jgi:hypothetical protein